MTPNSSTRHPQPNGRVQMERRALKALVANYVHELSNRHGSGEGEPVPDPRDGPESGSRPDG